MNLSSLLKTPYIAGGLGVTGVSAAGIAGGVHYFGDKPHLTGDERMVRWGYTKNHDKLHPNQETKLDSFSSQKHNDHFNLRPQDCFKTFFPGADDPGMPPSSTESVVISAPPTFNVPSATEAGPVGCKLMNLSATTDNKAFIFKSEIVAKTNNFGWAMSAGSTNLEKSMASNYVETNVDVSQINSEFRLLFMEKKRNAWSVIGGYFWLGTSLVLKGKGHFIVHNPEGDGHWLQLPLDNGFIINPFQRLDLTQYKTEDKWTNQEYSGIWNMADTGSGMFEKVVDGTWGISKGQDTHLNVNTIRAVYEKGIWKGANHLAADLGHMYRPFKNRKGKWVSVQNYCNALAAKAHLSLWEMEKLQDICYGK